MFVFHETEHEHIECEDKHAKFFLNILTF
jgi:hypothetical protein